MSTYGKREMVLDALNVQAQVIFKAKTQAAKAISNDSVKFWETALEDADNRVAAILSIGSEFGWSDEILLTYLEKCINHEEEKLNTLRDRMVNIL